MFLLTMVFAAAALGGGSDIECVIFQDGTKTHEQVMEECRAFAETYDWEAPEYEVAFEDFPISWHLFDHGLISSVDGVSDSGSTYTVQDGDSSLWSIADKLGVSFGALLAANSGPGLDPDLIRVGDVVSLP